MKKTEKHNRAKYMEKNNYNKLQISGNFSVFRLIFYRFS